MIENIKCKSCGCYLSSDKTKVGYAPKIDKDTKYCMRCFQIINYGEIDNKKVNVDLINDDLKNIDFKNNAIFLIVDLFDVFNSIVDLPSKNDVYILINKLSALPKKINRDKTFEQIENIFKTNNVNFKKIIMYDSIAKLNIGQVISLIKECEYNKKNIYIIGKTNVGKSSLINSLILKTKSNKKVAISPFANTTISFNKIKLKDIKINLIDTPGFQNQNGIFNYIDNKSIKNIFLNNTFNSLSFVIKDNKSAYFVENLFYIKVDEALENGVVTFYKYKNLNIQKSKKLTFPVNKGFVSYIINNNEEFILKEINLDKNKKYNIFVNGLCFISIMNISKITLSYSKLIEIYITEFAII